MIFLEEFIVLALLGFGGTGVYIAARYFLSRLPKKTEEERARESHSAEFERVSREAAAELRKTKGTVDGFAEEAKRLQKYLEGLETTREQKLVDADTAEAESLNLQNSEVVRNARAKRAKDLRLEALNMDDEIETARTAALRGLEAYEEAHKLWRQMDDRLRKEFGRGERAQADTRLAQLRQKLYPGVSGDPSPLAKVTDAADHLSRDSTVARARANVAQKLSERGADPDAEYRNHQMLE